MRTFIASLSLLLMTLCTLTLSAPTPYTLSPTDEYNSTTMDDDMITSTSEPITIMDTTVLEKSSITTSSTPLPVTTADENLIITSSIGTTTFGSATEIAASSMQTETEKEVISTESTTPSITTTIARPIDKIQSKKQKLKEPQKKLWSAKDNKSIKQKLQEPTTIDLEQPSSSIATSTVTSTSIKTAPTTIKSTTLTSTTTTTEFIPTTMTTATTDVSDNNNKDNVIVLNSNASGLIVVDVMENFGKENATASNFEIKMDLIEDEIFTTTTISPSTSEIQSASSSVAAITTISDELILVNEATESTTTQVTAIKWNEVRHNENSGDIKIKFDNIDLPHQNVNVSIENGELVIDSIDISVLNRVEEELRANSTESSGKIGNNSLEIVLIEEPVTTIAASTISATNHKIVNDDIKIKTTDKDSDTIFYISNTEVKLIESIPTPSPNDTSHKNRNPAIYEEDVIVDVPSTTTIVKNHTITIPQMDKYEEDIVLSPLTSDFDPKDINYIGEAFLDVEESSNGGAGLNENHHIIPLTSDVVVQPVELKDMPSINVPIIGEPPQIELAEMMFSDDYDSKQQEGFQFSPFLINSRLVKNELQAEEPHTDLDVMNLNGTILLANKTHSISVNTVINGTNMTTIASPYANATAAVIQQNDAEDIDNADMYDIQTLLVACLLTLAPLFLIVIIAFIIRFCWQKYRRNNVGHDLISDKSTDPLAEKNVDDMKSTESAMSLNRGNGNLQTQSTEMLLANANGDVTPGSNGCNHNDTNGSIIKMTMKNNHLIVETEERNDISRDTRETKMHYSPSEKDGVFIVEAARGADQNGSHKPSPLMQKPTEAPLEIPDEIKIDTLQSHFTPNSPEEDRKHQKQAEQVEVHTPPAEIKTVCNGTKTGLSQSDLSLTSSNSSNQNYTYGDRDAYQFEDKGYRGSSPKRIINVHCHDLKPLIENSPPAQVDDKPVITSAIYKEDNEPLKSDIQATINGNSDEIITNGSSTPKVHKINGIILKNGLDEIISVSDENCNETIVKNDCNGEMDSLSFLPAPPPAEENELMSMENFPPPPMDLNDSTVSQS
ncbi:hypothetical protein PVAND_012371 [Polypedilum vanderplanki]|uniref:Uncharacterized protein n=1 Tax=Polypedilum vanderplanki TaxID=319348 RepID=A0A9J6CLE0_POLVA|nr:hypothetical protein PVAND_012371 [Polypedilum vanderplanki]